ncbi:MAG TPA: hypothetical protein VMZ53_17165 [Kofleriaceae bacterium]|nr:hypothetical protein [Kofleriaceae bacterium]
MDKTQVYSGVLRIEDENVVIEGAQKSVLAEPGIGVWIMLYGCSVTAHTRRGFIERVEIDQADCMYREVGPVELVRGTLVVETGAPGSKLAGSRTNYFDSDGDRYGVIGGHIPDEGREVTVRVRKLLANMAYAARATERDIWFEED